MSQEAQILQLKWHQFQFRVELCPRPRYETQDAPKGPLDWLVRPLALDTGRCLQYDFELILALGFHPLKVFLSHGPHSFKIVRHFVFTIHYIYGPSLRKLNN